MGDGKYDLFDAMGDKDQGRTVGAAAHNLQCIQQVFPCLISRPSHGSSNTRSPGSGIIALAMSTFCCSNSSKGDRDIRIETVSIILEVYVNLRKITSLDYWIDIRCQLFNILRTKYKPSEVSNNGQTHLPSRFFLFRNCLF